MKYCSGMLLRYKIILCAAEIMVLGHYCMFEGRLPDPSCVNKIINWGLCQDLSDVQAFLGTMGVCFYSSRTSLTMHIISLNSLKKEHKTD
jgi:hypothetical protein